MSIRRKSKRDSFTQGLEEIQFIKKYFQAIKRCSPEDLEFIKDAIMTDPRQLMFSSSHSLRRSNLQNFSGEFPLYLAAKYNHKSLIELLIKGTSRESPIE